MLLCSTGQENELQTSKMEALAPDFSSKTQPRADANQVQKLEAELQEARGDARQLEEALTEQGRNLREKSVRRPRKFQSLTLIVWCFSVNSVSCEPRKKA